MSHKTVLPYVGGKQKVVKRLSRYFPKDLTVLGSPFIGGGSVEVYMASRGLRVFAADLCWELATFWQVLLDDPVGLADRWRSKHPVLYPLDSYRAELASDPDDPVEVAILCFILIMCGFSHIPARASGGSPEKAIAMRKHWRSLYNRMRLFRAPNLSVEHLDCFAFLDKYHDVVLYSDPPYANGSQVLYGFSEDLHGGFPHARWRDALMAHDAYWVQSYGDCELIRELYAECVIDELTWDYGARKGSSRGGELVIRPPGSPPLSEMMDSARSERQEAVDARKRSRVRDAYSVW